MALKPCPHCGHPISEKAEKCPECHQDPRLTPEELAQQEQQRKKKRKVAIIASAASFAVFLAVLCAIYIPRYIEYSRMADAYNVAQNLLDSGEYIKAADAFDAVADFKDSAQKALDARYQYVCHNQANTDATTLKFVEYLTSQNYPGIQELSDKIYKWKFDAYVTREENGSPATRNSFGKNRPFYFMLKAKGGKPGESLSVDYRIDFYVSSYASNLGYPDDSEYGSVPYKLFDGGEYWVGWAEGIGTARYSRVKITFYNAITNEALVSTEAYIY